MSTEHLIIYGVFDTLDNDRCFMVGSTVRELVVRANGTKKKEYKWFKPERHQHRIIWEGDVENDEFLPILRATKEAAWIGRMKTWWDQGGKNKMNPIVFALKSPNFFTELSVLGGKMGARSQSHEVRVRICRNNGLKHGRKGALRMHELYPNLARETLIRTHQEHPEIVENLKKGSSAAGTKGGKIGGPISAHRRWHESRGIVNPKCILCQKGA